MSRPLVLKRPQARNDLRDLARYIKQHNVVASRGFLKAANDAIKKLSKSPMMGGAWESDNPALSGLRVWPIPKYENYAIFYRPIVGGVEVIRIVHGMRAFETLLAR